MQRQNNIMKASIFYYHSGPYLCFLTVMIYQTEWLIGAVDIVIDILVKALQMKYMHMLGTMCIIFLRNLRNSNQNSSSLASSLSVKSYWKSSGYYIIRFIELNKLGTYSVNAKPVVCATELIFSSFQC